MYIFNAKIGGGGGGGESKDDLPFDPYSSILINEILDRNWVRLRSESRLVLSLMPDLRLRLQSRLGSNHNYR